MAKKAVKSNYRVVVYPERMTGTWRDGEEEHACKEIKEQIIRHVDGIAHRNPQVFIEFDSEHVCEFCGWPWETDGDGYLQCCIKAQEEWEAAQQPEPQPA